MLVTAILASTSVYALTLTAPSEVIVGESFTVTIEHNDTATADVKLFVQNQVFQNLSKIIIEGVEKSTFYYLKEVFPTQTTFTLTVVQGAHNAELCVRLRKTGKTSYEETCQSLVIQGSTSSEEETEEPLSQVPDEEEAYTNKTVTRTSSLPLTAPTPSAQNSVHNTLTESTEPLILNRSPPTHTFDTSVLWKLGFFTALCFIILALLVTGKI